MRKQKMKPIHPGEVLLEDYLKPLRMSQNALAKAIGVPADRISEIVRGRRGITGDTAVRLAHYFETTPGLWTGLQADYGIELALARLGPRGSRRCRSCGAAPLDRVARDRPPWKPIRILTGGSRTAPTR